MKKRFFAVLTSLALVLAPWPAGAQSSTICTAGNAVPFTHETITVSTSSVGLTASVYAPTDGTPRATVALLSVQGGQDVRVWFDGTAPTTSAGIVVASGQSLYVCGTVIQTVRLIRDGASDAEVAVQYFNYSS